MTIILEYPRNIKYLVTFVGYRWLSRLDLMDKFRARLKAGNNMGLDHQSRIGADIEEHKITWGEMTNSYFRVRLLSHIKKAQWLK
jgi:hypothetical protein